MGVLGLFVCRPHRKRNLLLACWVLGFPCLFVSGRIVTVTRLVTHPKIVMLRNAGSYRALKPGTMTWLAGWLVSWRTRSFYEQVDVARPGM